MTKYKKRKPLSWFKEGKVIVAGEEATIFNPSFKITTEDHGRALYNQQDKGYRYNEVKP